MNRGGARLQLKSVRIKSIAQIVATGALAAFSAAFTPGEAAAQATVSNPEAVMNLEWRIGPWRTLWNTRHFASARTGEDVGYYVYLPPGYDAEPERRYPLLVWLHGAYGRPHEASPVITRLDRAIREGAATPMIVVSVLDPTGLGMWTDSKDGRLPMETLIIDELIPHVDAAYRTIPDRAHRAIEGFSMGGYGAAYLGFKYPDLFASVSLLGAALHRPETLKDRRAAIFANVFGDDIDYARERSPWRWAEENAGRLKESGAHIRIFVGADDALVDWNREFHELLEARGVAHQWGVVPDSQHDVEQLMRNWPGDPFAFYRGAFGAEERR
jgi:endo-1,4-beta-xylanase